jgi:transposase
MLSLPNNSKVYLACGATDLRCGIDRLAALVQHHFMLDPFSSNMFVFCNRKQDKIKILIWDISGFWLLYKRLEQGRFQWPQTNQEALAVTYRELRWLLDGLSISENKAFGRLTYSTMM